MKFLTETKTEGRIVEMSAEEVRAFRRLVLAVEGNEFEEVYNSGFGDDWRKFYREDHRDMSTTFNVMANWVEQRCNLSELEHALDGIRKAIGEKG